MAAALVRRRSAASEIARARRRRPRACRSPRPGPRPRAGRRRGSRSPCRGYTPRRVGAQDRLDAAGVREERLPVEHVEQAQRTNRVLDADARIEREVGRWPEVAATRGIGGRPIGTSQLVEEPHEVAQDAGAQHRGQRPQLGDRQRRDLLVRVDEAAQAVADRARAGSRRSARARRRRSATARPPARRPAAAGGGRSRAADLPRPAARRAGSSSSCRGTTRRPWPRVAPSASRRDQAALRVLEGPGQGRRAEPRPAGRDGAVRAGAWRSASARARSSRASVSRRPASGAPSPRPRARRTLARSGGANSSAWARRCRPARADPGAPAAARPRA